MGRVASRAHGPRGTARPSRPCGPDALGNGVLTNNFNGDVRPGETKTVTIGAFTIQEYNSGSSSSGECGDETDSQVISCGPCSPITLDAHTQSSGYFFGSDETSSNSLGGPYVNSAFSTIAYPFYFSDFTAVLSTASSSVWGIVGVVPSGTDCLTSGGLTGD